MADKSWLENYMINQKTATWINRLLVSLLITCFAGGLVIFSETIFLNFRGKYLIPLVFIMTLEAFFSQVSDKQHIRSFPERDWLLYHISEWILILLVIRTILYLQDGFSQFVYDINLPSGEVLAQMLTRDFYITLVFAAAAFILAIGFGKHLRSLESSEADLAWERISEMEINRTAAHRSMTSLIFILGIILTLATIFSRYLIRLGQIDGNLKNPVLFMMGFFLTGFILLSMSHFSILRARWLWMKMKVRPNVSQRWFTLAAIFFGSLFLIALILPTQYSLGLLDVLKIGLAWIWNVLWFGIEFVMLVLHTFIYLIAALINLIAPETIANGASQMEMPEMAEQPTLVPAGTPLPWLEIFKSILFWGILLAILVYGIDYYFKQNPAIIEFLRGLKPFQWVGKCWNWLRMNIRKTARKVRRSARENLTRLQNLGRRKSKRKQVRVINPRTLPPREQIQFYYLALLKRSEEKGMGRQTSQTPQQYAVTLLESLEEVEEDLSGITDQFNEARYSPHMQEEEDARRARGAWSHIRKALARLRQKETL